MPLISFHEVCDTETFVIENAWFEVLESRFVEVGTITHWACADYLLNMGGDVIRSCQKNNTWSGQDIICRSGS